MNVYAKRRLGVGAMAIGVMLLLATVIFAIAGPHGPKYTAPSAARGSVIVANVCGVNPLAVHRVAVFRDSDGKVQHFFYRFGDNYASVADLLHREIDCSNHGQAACGPGFVFDGYDPDQMVCAINGTWVYEYTAQAQFGAHDTGDLGWSAE